LILQSKTVYKLFTFVKQTIRMTLKKNVYSIKDLENLSGIKAHTIRIWEKRYGILEPMRTDSNIRFYDSNNLQKLLNITLLHNHGYKISKISQYPENKIPELVKEIASDKNANHHALNAFKVAMMNFDQALFTETYKRLSSEKSFREIFQEVFIPLLSEVGILWQTETITPAHEHFIANLIKQKIIINTEKLQSEQLSDSEKTFVLFLPENEIHDIVLLYLNYELVFNNCKSVYLGANVPLENLKKVNTLFENIVFVAYLSTQPGKDEIDSYLRIFSNEILQNENNELWILGNMARQIDTTAVDSKIQLIFTLKEFIKNI